MTRRGAHRASRIPAGLRDESFGRCRLRAWRTCRTIFADPQAKAFSLLARCSRARMSLVRSDSDVHRSLGGDLSA